MKQDQVTVHQVEGIVSFTSITAQLFVDIRYTDLNIGMLLWSVIPAQCGTMG